MNFLEKVAVDRRVADVSHFVDFSQPGQIKMNAQTWRSPGSIAISLGTLLAAPLQTEQYWDVRTIY